MIQILVPGIMQKTERVLFNGPEEKKVEISGEHCQGNDLTKKWVFHTWKQDGHGNWVGAVQETVRIDGNGRFELLIKDDLRPILGDRLGVLCAENDICGMALG